MEKILFENDFNDNLNKNFEKQSRYFGFNFYAFTELGGLVW